MCGFAGIISGPTGHPTSVRAVAKHMARTLEHRGPDDHASWADPSGRIGLGFQRLSIIDLSTGGRQPMTSSCGRFTLVFNGEVYNFRELRAELEGEGCAFSGQSDSEVVLMAFAQWGIISALQRFVGMFAMGLWDQAEETLHLIRDRLGIKPLYLGRTEQGGFAFGSELRALLQSSFGSKDTDIKALADYCGHLYFPGETTPFPGIRKLLPGHILSVRVSQLNKDRFPRSRPWWELNRVRRESHPKKPERSDDQTIQELRELISDAVRLRMVADVPIGALLSGGIDSTIVAAMMQRHSDRPVRTFTIGFDDPQHDESNHAEAVAEHLGTEHTTLHVTAEDVLRFIPKIPVLFDEPMADPSLLPTYLVSALAREHVTVALSGDGGDELFAGYTRHVVGHRLIPSVSRLPRKPRRWLAELLRFVPTSQWERLSRSASRGRHTMRLVEQKVGKLTELLDCDSPGDMYLSLLRAGGRPETLLSNPPEPGGGVETSPEAEASFRTLADMLEFDQRHYLPGDLLQKVDRASMAVGLEVRVPLLDHRVVEYSWTLPDHRKIRNGRGKWPLRAILASYVPSTLIDRPKMGFTVPLAKWLRGPLRPWADNILLSANVRRDLLFDRDAVADVYHRFQAGEDQLALRIWPVLIFEAWRRHWND